MQKASRAIVILMEPSMWRELTACARPSVNLNQLIEDAYWAAWDAHSDYVSLILRRWHTRDGKEKFFTMPWHWFNVAEGRDDA